MSALPRQDRVKRWACPHCGATGYVVADVLRCVNTGCPDTHEYDPTTGDRLYGYLDSTLHNRGYTPPWVLP